MATKTAELHLPYFKAGDDMQQCFKAADGNADTALELHAQLMDAGAARLRAVKQAGQGKVQLEFAGTHIIRVVGDAQLIDPMIAQGLLDPACEDDDEDDEDIEDDEDAA